MRCEIPVTSASSDAWNQLADIANLFCQNVDSGDISNVVCTTVLRRLNLYGVYTISNKINKATHVRSRAVYKLKIIARARSIND